MSHGTADFYSRSAVNRGLYVIGYLLKHLCRRYKAEPVLAALSEDIGGLAIKDVVRLVDKQYAEMTLRWLHALAAKCGAEELRDDKLKEDLHSFIAEAAPGTFD